MLPVSQLTILPETNEIINMRARYEHSVESLSVIKTTHKELLEIFGVGVYHYFNTLVIFMGYYFVNFVMNMGRLINHVNSEHYLDNPPTLFFILIFFIALLICMKYGDNVERTGFGDLNENFIVQYIRDNITSRFKLFMLRLAVYVIIVGLFISYYFLQLCLGGSSGILAALIYTIIDNMLKLICFVSTSFEAHKHFSTHVLSNCIKNYILKVVLFVIFYITSGETNEQMFILLLITSLVTPFIGLASTSIFRCYFKNIPFYLSEEYSQLLFIQVLMYQTMFNYPFAPLIAFIGCVLQYCCDKFKIIKLIKRLEYYADEQRIFLYICVALNYATLFIYLI